MPQKKKEVKEGRKENKGNRGRRKDRGREEESKILLKLISSKSFH